MSVMTSSLSKRIVGVDERRHFANSRRCQRLVTFPTYRLRAAYRHGVEVPEGGLVAHGVRRLILHHYRSFGRIAVRGGVLKLDVVGVRWPMHGRDGGNRPLRKFVRLLAK